MPSCHQSNRARAIGLRGELVLLLALLFANPPAHAGDEPKWLQFHSTHFSVLTDANEKRGREVAFRLEQMRTVFGQTLFKTKLRMPVPVTVIALKNEKLYGQIAPSKQGWAAGFFVPGADRIYLVLNLSEAEPWRAVAHPLAHYFLNYNYPPAQGWFDEGLAEYFSSIRLDDKSVAIGADPELTSEWYEDIFDEVRFNPSTPQSLTQLLSSPVWISMPDLFTMKHDGSGAREGTHHTLYYAQSWMVVHYLINRNKMQETGTYFDLVLNQKVPAEKAMVQAWDLSPAQMEQAVRDYFKSLQGLGVAMDRSKIPGNQAAVEQPYHLPSPFGPDDLAVTWDGVTDPDARAMIADVMARVPEHHDQALHDLAQLVADPKDNETAHRALAWDHLQQKQFDQAADELEKAADLNAQDPWIWYYRAVLKYRRAQTSQQEMQGIANMMQDLRAVIDWYPESAEAFNMLGMARVEGGGMNSALEAQRQAIALAPRNYEYQFNLGQIYVAGKKWDQARELFTRLKNSADPKTVAAAKHQLDDLDTLQKYGIRPQRAGEKAAPTGAASTPSASASKTLPDDESDEPVKPVAQNPGMIGPVQFMKGKLVASDCSKPPGAVVTFVSGTKTYKLHTPDFKSLTVIGEEGFSCDWKNRVIAVNFRPVGKGQGELVSMELE
jgi:tetratricopeptide (TPR) repeat protein